MRTFRCDHCDSPVYFENPRCVACGHTLAFLPDQFRLAALERTDDGLWRVAAGQSDTQADTQADTQPAYRLCHHYVSTDTCNWAVEAADTNELCVSCRLTQEIPDLSLPGRQASLYKMELGKRRLVFNLRELGLPLFEHETINPLRFSFLENVPEAGFHVITGHDHGHITINLSEADDVERMRSRNEMGEPYRTVLGHFRHEIGHFYWDELIAPQEQRLEAFRALFGDEREDYGEALKRHYEQPDLNWANEHISAYASAHPWEGWAETWAHYMHMRAVIETADDFADTVRLPGQDAKAARLANDNAWLLNKQPDFDRLILRWMRLGLALNALNRSMGLDDAYPFTLSEPVREKLRFVHDTVRASAILA